MCIMQLYSRARDRESEILVLDCRLLFEKVRNLSEQKEFRSEGMY